MFDDPILQTMTEAVETACRLTAKVQCELVTEDTLIKKDRSPVTVADFGAQAVVSAALAAAHPEIPLMGEESAEALRRDPELGGRVLDAVNAVIPELDAAGVDAAIDRGHHGGGREGRFFTLDPIDGTKGFLRGEQYAVALALIDAGVVVAGVLGCPNLPVDGSEGGAIGCLLAGIPGQGAWTRPLDERAWTPIAVSPVTEGSASTFTESVESGHSRHDQAAAVAEALGIVRPSVRMDSQCKYAALARGDAEIYLRLPTRPGYVERIWDHAAGWAVIVAAGGRVTDVDGRELEFGHGAGLEGNRGVIATNGPLHDRVLEALAAAGVGA